MLYTFSPKITILIKHNCFKQIKLYCKSIQKRSCMAEDLVFKPYFELPQYSRSGLTFYRLKVLFLPLYFLKVIFSFDSEFVVFLQNFPVSYRMNKNVGNCPHARTHRRYTQKIKSFPSLETARQTRSHETLLS